MHRAIAAAIAMAHLLLACACALSAAGVAVPLSAAGVAAADPAPGPPYIDHVEWAHWGNLSSLRVFPTGGGRLAAGEIGTTAQADEAWTEILAKAPDADLPGMRAQFTCHWQLAEFVQPGKSSWNLEPWRPDVDYDTMLAAGCNPGGAEEPF